MDENLVRHLKRDGGSIVKKRRRKEAGLEDGLGFHAFGCLSRLLFLLCWCTTAKAPNIRISALDMYYYMVMVVVDIIVLSPARLLRL